MAVAQKRIRGFGLDGRIRPRDRLQVETAVDQGTVDTLVPNFILQPLVENAIRHGIGPRRTPGLIRISAWRDHDDVWMEIRDNGVGFARGRGSAPQRLPQFLTGELAPERREA